jgi:Leucine-rich repeat (LRR) protein
MLFGLRGLERLDIANNRLTSLNKSIGLLTGLRELDVSENRLVFLPQELAECSELRDVELYGNMLKDVHPLSQLQQLVNIDLSHNELAELPPLSTGGSLRCLDMSSNKIMELPAGFADLNSLEWLDLSGNRLTSIAALRGLRLRELHVDNNSLKSLPIEMVKGIGLETFSALDNPFRPLIGRRAGVTSAVDIVRVVREHTKEDALPDVRHHATPSIIVAFSFSLAIGGVSGARIVIDLFYKKFRNARVRIQFLDGSRFLSSKHQS